MKHLIKLYMSLFAIVEGGVDGGDDTMHLSMQWSHLLPEHRDRSGQQLRMPVTN
jgi:hypothetical protein